MKATVQTRAIEGKESLNRDHATLIFGLSMAVVFVGMMILNAIS
jgi:hypothetical protein